MRNFVKKITMSESKFEERKKTVMNINGDTAEILLHGIIGERIDGTSIAHEMKSLKERGVKSVKIRINSIGGSIIEGFSIVSANLDLIANGVEVETINEGVADSMASVVLASGTKGKRSAYDYSLAVIHNPLLGGTSLNDIEDEELKNIAINFKQSLVTIYSKSLNIDASEISDLMDKETMLSSDQMVKFGLVDNIIKTDISKIEIKNLSLAEIFNVYEGMNKQSNKSQTKKEEKMNKLSEFFNLSQDSSEDVILDEVKKLRKLHEDAQAKVKELEDQILENELNLEKFQNEAIDQAVSSAIESGKIEETQKTELVETAKKIGLENFNKMVAAMKVVPVDVVKEIENRKKDNDDSKKDFDWYRKNDPQALKEMEEKEPSRFARLYKEWENQ